jgi:hypothetical protein
MNGKAHKKGCVAAAAGGMGQEKAEDGAIGVARPAPSTESFVEDEEEEEEEEEQDEQEEEEEEEEDDGEEEWTDEEDAMPDSSLAALLQQLPREDTYKILLMTFQQYRDDYEEDHGEALETAKELKEHFDTFLKGMEEDELLPDWWDEKTKAECENLAETFKWEPAGSQENMKQ